MSPLRPATTTAMATVTVTVTVTKLGRLAGVAGEALPHANHAQSSRVLPGTTMSSMSWNCSSTVRTTAMFMA